MRTPTAPSAPSWIVEAIADLPPILTVAEAIVTLRTSRRQFYRLLAAGRITTVRQAEGGSSRHLIPRSEIARYLQSLTSGS